MSTSVSDHGDDVTPDTTTRIAPEGADEDTGRLDDSAEARTLLGVLDRNRRTFGWKTSGLSPDGLRGTTAASAMTLGGLVKHLALVEADWLAVKLCGQPYGQPWDDVDFDTDPDWEWRTGATDPADELDQLWRAEVARSRQLVGKVLTERGLDGPASFTWPNGTTPTVRDMLLDMIEEYARHVGHADLLREAVDGLTGENPPRDFIV